VAAGPERQRIMVHARTHGREVQSSWVVNEVIRWLLDTTAAAQEIRGRFIFNIVPMYNPDGVELGCPRVNANDVDMEMG
jgi:murein tripeptide amidase MpaA